jgi:hypothetical protein
MYLVDHPAAKQTPPNFYETVSVTNCQQFKKKWKNRTVVKAREKETIDY